MEGHEKDYWEWQEITLDQMKRGVQQVKARQDEASILLAGEAGRGLAAAATGMNLGKTGASRRQTWAI
jgi:hypothetical protein